MLSRQARIIFCLRVRITLPDTGLLRASILLYLFLVVSCVAYYPILFFHQTVGFINASIDSSVVVTSAVSSFGFATVKYYFPRTCAELYLWSLGCHGSLADAGRLPTLIVINGLVKFMCCNSVVYYLNFSRVLYLLELSLTRRTL